MNGPHDVAVDSSGNLYIADYFNNRVLKEAPSNGAYTQTVMPTSQLNGPAGVVVDGNGNVFIADSGNDRVLKETPTESGYSESMIGSGMANPFGVAVDVYGNLFVADSGNGRILVEAPSGGSYDQTPIVSDLMQPFGVAVDASGNLYIADRGANQVFKETQTVSGLVQSVITSNVVAPYKVMVDGSGTVYVADTFNNRILMETWNSDGGAYVESTMIELPNPMGMMEDASGSIYIAAYGYGGIVKVQTTALDFGSVAVGDDPGRATLTFVFNRAGTLPYAPVVLTKGAANLDFQDAGTGTCTTTDSSHSYNSGDLCTVDVSFGPLFPGIRFGAVEVLDSDGFPITTTYLAGTGSAAQLALIPGAQTTVASDVTAGLGNPVGIAFDGNHNLYIADWGNDRVVMLPWSNGVYGAPAPVGSGLVGPTGVAVDGAGNIYIAGYDSQTVLKETIATGGQSVIGSGTFLPAGVAVDGAGNLYVADYGTNNALLETVGGNFYTQSVISSDLTNPYGIAVDSAGNVYIADSGTNRVVKNTLSNGAYSQSTIASEFDEPQGVILDGAGDVYVTDTNRNRVAMLPWNGGTYGTPIFFGNSLSAPQAFAFDDGGNLYIGDSWNNRVVKVDFSQTPPLDFGTVTPGQTSEAQTVVVANPGTAALTFASIRVSSGFSLQTDCSTDTSLAPGATCSLQVSFAPQAGGTISGTLEIDSETDPEVTTISLQGVGQTASTQLAFGGNIPSSISNGGNLGTLTVNVLDGSGNTVTDSTAAVALQITGPAGFTAYHHSVNAVAGIATFNLTSLSLTAAGNYTIVASSSGLTSAQSGFAVSPAAAFGLTLDSDTLTVVSGDSGTVNLTLGPSNGFTGDIALSCTNLPAYASCSFSPASVHADGSNTSLPSILTVSTKAISMAANRSGKPLFACWSGIGLFGLLLFSKRRRLLGISSAMLLAGLLMALPGCGSDHPAAPVKQNTPTGSYSVNLNATSGGITRSSVLTLNVE